MKTVFNYLAICLAGMAIAAFTLSSCKKDDKNDGPSGKKEETVTKVFRLVPGELELKSSLDGTTVSWSEGDKVSVLPDVGKDTAAVISAEGTITVELDKEATNVTIVYPYSTKTTVSNGALNIDFPSVQRAVAGTFAPGAAVSVGTAAVEEESIDMTMISSFIKYTVADDDVIAVRIENDSVALSGNAAVSPDAITPSEEAQKSVTLTGGLAKGSDYYFAVLPSSVAKLRVNVTYASGEVLAAAVDSVDFVSKVIADFGELPNFNNISLENTYFVSLEGSGDKSGRNWGNSFDMAAFKEFFVQGHGGAKFYFQGGEYPISSTDAGFSVGPFDDALGMRLYGGYAANSKGVDLSKRNAKTIFTGSGKYGILNILNNCRFTFDNFTFSDGYSSSSIGAPKATAVYVTGSNAAASQIEFVNCVFKNNKNESTNGSYCGGAAIWIHNGMVKCDGCTITENTAYNNVAVRTQQAGATFYLHNSAVYANVPTSNGPHYGYVMKNSGTMFISNSTITNNRGTVGRKGAIQDEKAMVIVSSTISETGNGTGENGTIIREAGNIGISAYMNSIVLNTNNANNWNALWIENGKWTSKGYNLLSTVSKKSDALTYNTSDTDVQTTLDEIGAMWNNTNLVYTWKTLPEAFKKKCTVAEIEEALTGFAPDYNGMASGARFIEWVNAHGGFAVNQLGEDRDGAALLPGSYEKD